MSDVEINPKAWAEAVTKHQHNDMPLWVYLADHPEAMEVSLALLRAYLSSAPQAEGGAVPDGWKLVPVEPTPEMLAAAWREVRGSQQRAGIALLTPGPGVVEWWRAMLASAPPAALLGVEK